MTGEHGVLTVQGKEDSLVLLSDVLLCVRERVQERVQEREEKPTTQREQALVWEIRGRRSLVHTKQALATAKEKSSTKNQGGKGKTGKVRKIAETNPFHITGGLRVLLRRVFVGCFTVVWCFPSVVGVLRLQDAGVRTLTLVCFDVRRERESR
jgi:hypothetical protein